MISISPSFIWKAILLIYNPKSRHGQSLNWLSLIEKKLYEGKKTNFTFFKLDITQPDFSQTVETILGTSDIPTSEFLLLIMGGDGTIHSCLNSILQITSSLGKSMPPIWILGMGTGNDIAKTLHMPVLSFFSIIRKIELIPNQIRNRQLDIGIINDEKYFVDMVSVGLDAEILELRDQWVKRLTQRLGRRIQWIPGYLLYALSTFVKLCSTSKRTIRLIKDDQVWWEGQYVNILVKNMKIHAGEFIPIAEANPYDHFLDIWICQSVWEYIWVYLFSWRWFPSWIRRFQRWRGIYAQFVSFKIENCSTPVPIQVDGETQGKIQTLTLRVLPSVIPVCGTTT